MPRFAEKTLTAIDEAVQQNAEQGFRTHLGGSIIGRVCARELWYTFRWARQIHHHSQLLRLFDRGNLEEARFIRWLTEAGIAVDACDQETGEQHRVSAHEGHFGGSLDSRLENLPDYPGKTLGEFKTYNKRRFTELKKKGVRTASPEHYVQMQVYMELGSLPAALYLAVCKDNDELYAEVVEFVPEVAAQYIHRALLIILADRPPQRISSNPGWYECKFCDYWRTCHDGEPLAVNCRTCIHSKPTQGATWTCEQYNCVLTKEQQLAACPNHQPYFG